MDEDPVMEEVLFCSALCMMPKQSVSFTPARQGLRWLLPLPTLPASSLLSLKWTEGSSCFEPMAQQHGFLKNDL